MFLSRLELIEKEAFVSLAVNAAKANGRISGEEYQMIEEYCKEMGIVFFDAKNVKSMEEVIGVYSEASEQHKKIAVLEIIGLMFADGGYDDEERAFVDKFADGISVSQSSVKKCEESLKKYIDMSQELLECIE